MQERLKKISKLFTGESYGSALLRMLPAVLMAGLVPLIVWQVEYTTKLTQYSWFSLEAVSFEFFLAPKSLVLTFLFFLMITIVIARFRKEKSALVKAKLLFPILFYAFFVVLSSLFSVNKVFSFTGSYEQFEDIWVLLSYVTVVVYIYLFAKGPKEKQVIIDAICFNITAVSLIGTLQGLSFDLLKQPWFQKLITTDEFLTAIGGKFDIGFGQNSAYGTLYNPNYLGVYGSFLIPFIASLLLLEKNLFRRLWHLCNLVLLFCAVLFSGSRAGLISVSIAAFVLLIFCFRSILKWWFLSIPVMNLAIAILLLVNTYTDNSIFDRMKTAFSPVEQEIEEEVTSDGSVIKKTGLTKLYTTKDSVVIRYNEKTVAISIYVEEFAYGFYAYDEAGNQVELEANSTGTEFRFLEPELQSLVIEPMYLYDTLGFQLTIDKPYIFWFNGTEYVGFNALGRESVMTDSKAAVFTKNLDMFSGRFFIWGRTIPLLKKHIFIGSGPDTFLLEFPQTDYLNMQKNGFENMVMTKPHSMYLQIGVQTGVLSLLCLLVFYFWYAGQSIKLFCFKRFTSQLDAIGVAAFIGSVGFMISSISNDSMVVTSPVFYVMVGVGVAANRAKAVQRKIEKEEKLKNLASSKSDDTAKASTSEKPEVLE